MTTIDEAAKRANEQYKSFDWFFAVGIAEDRIIIYTTKKKSLNIVSYCGYPVDIKYVGKVRPANV